MTERAGLLPEINTPTTIPQVKPTRVEANSLLVVTSSKPLSQEQMERIRNHLQRVAYELSAKLIIVDDSLSIELHQDIRPLIEMQIDEQKKTNHLLTVLIEALASEDDEPKQATTYMDGSRL